MYSVYSFDLKGSKMEFGHTNTDALKHLMELKQNNNYQIAKFLEVCHYQKIVFKRKNVQGAGDN